MTGWTPDEPTVLARASSPRLTAGDAPGPEAELGMVLVHGELYIRGYWAPSPAGFRPRRKPDGAASGQPYRF
jgi:hypothetical protein